MSLDKNLFTLLLTPNAKDPDVVDLADPSGVVHYWKRRVQGPVYRAELYEPVSESLLASASAPHSTSKYKTLELYNPTSVVPLKFTGILSFRWSFKWEEHEFEWRREACYMIRKPDPQVLVAITKEPPGRIKTRSVQILDYNLNRFDIEDRKGLEIVILMALLTFQDSNEGYHSEPSPSISLADVLPRARSPSPPPPPPSAPTNIGKIVEAQAAKGEANEVEVGDDGSAEDYAMYCLNLLHDDALLFIIIRSAETMFVPKVLEVVHQTIRLRHRAGLSDDLHTYITTDSGASGKRPKRINLDDDVFDKKYKPPPELTVHLSKIPMPELEPKSSVKPSSSTRRKESDHKDKGKGREDKGKGREDKGKKKRSQPKVSTDSIEDVPSPVNPHYSPLTPPATPHPYPYAHNPYSHPYVYGVPPLLPPPGATPLPPQLLYPPHPPPHAQPPPSPYRPPYLIPSPHLPPSPRLPPSPSSPYQGIWPHR